MTVHMKARALIKYLFSFDPPVNLQDKQDPAKFYADLILKSHSYGGGNVRFNRLEYLLT